MLEIKEYVNNRKQVIKDIIAAKEKQKKLAIIQIGDNQASNSYVKGKLKDCEEVGIPTVLCKRDKSISQDELDRVVSNLNNDESIGGIIVQLPLPKHLTVNLELIDDDKDVDGFKITSNFVPCTPLGIITYLESQNIEFDGKNAVVIGRSDIVGKPMAKL